MRIQADRRSAYGANSMALDSQIAVAGFCFGVSWHFDVSRFLTDGDQGNPLIALVANDAICFRVEHGLAIRDEQIPVMAVMQVHACHPATIGCPEHRGGRHVPVVEIAYETNTRSSRCVAEKVHMMKRPLRRAGRQSRV